MDIAVVTMEIKKKKKKLFEFFQVLRNSIVWLPSTGSSALDFENGSIYHGNKTIVLKRYLSNPSSKIKV
jgi:hypothetical protein